jgi:FlaA1/EpsC-like NDP-sugar epimerase
LRERLFVSRHRIWQIVIDAGLVALALYLSYLLRFDFTTPRVFAHQLRWVILPVVVAEVLVFMLFGLYNKWWRYSGVRDLVSVFLATLAAVALGMIVAEYFADRVQPAIFGRWHNDITAHRLPWSILALDWLLTFGLMGGARLLARTIWEGPWRQERGRDRKKVLVVGAGDAGELVVREMLKTRQIRYRPVGFVDDDQKKKNLRIHGVRVVGTTRHLPALIEEFAVDEVIIAMPSVGGRPLEDIALSCKKANVPVKTLPGVYELIKGTVTIEQLRGVQVEDILGRHEVSLNYDSIDYIGGEVVMVTGAGGSIGSELCRQIATMSPRLLVLVEHSEGSLFQIAHELETERHFTDLAVCLVDIRDKTKLRELFETYRPDIVFHAAAFKHVPMMQANPAEAFDNNCFATLSLIEDAVRFGASRLVSISTDKAVEPETVMGLSKALTERIVETMARETDDTKLMTVRFGNVLGSSGSVVPLFQRQIAAGGPVTVTDERMTRFFMTIPEAVRLVIQAGAMGAGGEIFVLDMGEPMRIVDLAREMIRLSGLEPDRDIEIVFTGNRGAEKLDEKLFSAGEQAVGTTHPKIAMAVRRPVPRSVLRQELSRIREALARHDVETALRLAREVVQLAAPSGAAPASGAAPENGAPAAADAAPADDEEHPADSGNGRDGQALSSPSTPPASASASPAPPASPTAPSLHR